jgi:urea carboxylase system permease
VTATVPPVPAEAGPPGLDDQHDLLRFGYAQQLHRKLGPYSSFAAGFSFVSILTTVFQLFVFGFAFGGASFFWTWPLVFAGQMLVALNFAELAAHYPLSGCIYQWSRRLSSGLTGWFAGWMMLIGEIVSVAAAAIALQVVLPSIWAGFQFVHGSSSLDSVSGATNAVLLGTLLICVTTAISAAGVRLTSAINSMGVTCELAGVALLVALLFIHAKRGPGVVLHTTGVSSHGYLWSFLISALMAAYVMYGFDSAGELSEETRAPRRTASRAIIRALAVSGIGGALLLLSALMAAPSLTDGKLATEGLPYVLTSRLGTAMGKVLLADVAVAVTVCTLAVQTAATRLLYSMARDRVLPFSRHLSKVPARTGTPVLATVAIGALAAAILLVNVGKAQLFLALTSVAVVVVYLAYLLVTVPTLVRRLRGWPATASPPGTGGAQGARAPFFLGRYGLAINLGAVAYGAFMAVNIGWPRAIVYGSSWYLRYFAPLFLAAAVVCGALAYLRRGGWQAAPLPHPRAALLPTALPEVPE